MSLTSRTGDSNKATSDWAIGRRSAGDVSLIVLGYGTPKGSSGEEQMRVGRVAILRGGRIGEGDRWQM